MLLFSKCLSSSKRNRNWDVIKGVMLLVLCLNHLLPWFPIADFLLQWTVRPIGYFTVLEGFVFVAGVTLCHSMNAARSSREVWATAGRRLQKLYPAHLFLISFVVVLVNLVPHNLLHNWGFQEIYDRPLIAWLKLAFFGFERSILNIIPMHILLTLLGPLIAYVVRGNLSRVAVLLTSFALYGMAQELAPRDGVFANFNVLAWQLLFVLGFLEGSRTNDLSERSPGRLAVAIVLFLAVLLFAFRYDFLPEPSLFASPIKNQRDLPIVTLLNFLLVSLLCSWLGRFRLAEEWYLRKAFECLGRHTLLIFTWNVCCTFLCRAFAPTLREFGFILQLSILVVCLFGAAIPLWIQDRRARPSASSNLSKK